jgi:hypothetical protein
MKVIEKIKIGVTVVVLIFWACVEHNQKEKTYNAKSEVENIKGLEYKRFGIKGTTVSGQLPREGNIFLRSELGMGGWDGAIDHQNNIAYIASGFGLRTFDVSDPANIKFLGVIGLPYFCYDVDVSGGIAFVACGTAGLRIIDVSNPEYLREITFYDTPGYAWGVYRVGTIVYVADGLSGLQIIDVSNPFNPQFLGWLDTPGEAIDVFVKDKKAYVADRDGGLRIIDVSDPTAPQEIGAFAPAETKDFWDVYVVGTTAYVADGNPSGLSPALRIIDVSDPANPTQISSITLFADRTGWWGANWLSYKGNYIFYSNYWAWGGTNPPWGGVRVIDVSNPSSPFICAEIYEPWTETHGVFVNPTANLLYLVWDWQRFATFDISNPCNPVLLNIWQAPGDSWGVALDPSRNIAYIGDWRGGLRIIDISDISFPKEISYWDTPCYARGMDVKTHPSGATIAYVADGCGGLRIIDVTDPQYPQEASFFIPWGVVEPEIGHSWDVFVKGATLAFFAASVSGLFILDVSDYENPISVGWIGVNAIGVFVDGNTAYVAAGNQGLRIIDVSDLSNPLQIGSVSTSNAWDVFVFQRGSSTIAAVADREAGLRLIDVTNPASPYIISTFDTQDAMDVWVEGNIAYVGDFSGGITLIDISDLANPTGLSYFITSSDVTELTVRGGIAFAAARFGGLMIFTFQAPVLSLSPDSLNFGPVNQGEFKILPLDIRNDGDVFMTVRNVQVIPEGGAFRIEGMPTLPFSVEPGRSQRVYVKFSPPVTGSFSGNIFISSDGGGGVVSLYGNGVQPSFSVSPTSITFGDVPVGGSSDKVFEIRNEGTGILRVDFIGVLDAGFSLVNPPEVPFYVNPGTRGIVVRFFPQAATEYSGRVLIRTNVGDGVVRLFGNGVASKLGIAPESLNFGGVKVGGILDKVFSIRNEGDAQMELRNISISGTGFQVLNMPTLPMILNPGDSVDIVVRFSPVMKGVVSGTVQVSSDGGSGFVSLSGAGLAPVIYVNPLSLDFGGVKVGGFLDKVFSVKNVGDAQMELKNISISGTGFQILNMPSLPMILDPGASVDIVVRFSPVMKGVVSGTVQVSSDGGSGLVSLSGAGLAPVIYVNPLSLDFGGVKVGGFLDKVFSVKNVGDAQMELKNISISGTGFQILNMPSLPMILNPGDSVDIVVRFSPDGAGGFAGNVIVETEGGNAFIRLSGKGQRGVLSLSPLSLNFGQVKLGERKEMSFKIRNEGEEILEVERMEISGLGFEIKEGLRANFSVSAGEEKEVKVVFTPQVVGAASGTIMIFTSYGSGQVMLSGEGASPFLIVNPATLNFGDVVKGTEKRMSFSIANGGTYELVVTGIEIVEGGEGFKFVSEVSVPVVIDKGTSREIGVIFSPVRKGVHRGKVLIWTTGGQGQVELHGGGLFPEISYEEKIEFGRLTVRSKKEYALRITNEGNWPAIITKIAVEGEGFEFIDTSILPVVISIGETKVLFIRFSPGSVGEKLGKMKMEGNFGEAEVEMVGVGVKKKGCTIWHTPEDFIPNTFLIFLIISLLKFRMVREKKRFLFLLKNKILTIFCSV